MTDSTPCFDRALAAISAARRLTSVQQESRGASSPPAGVVAALMLATLAARELEHALAQAGSGALDVAALDAAEVAVAHEQAACTIDAWRECLDTAASFGTGSVGEEGLYASLDAVGSEDPESDRHHALAVLAGECIHNAAAEALKALED